VNCKDCGTDISKLRHWPLDCVRVLKERVEAIMQGQEALKAQTVRIRLALTDGALVNDIDTEDIAKRVRKAADGAIYGLWRAADMLSAINRSEPTSDRGRASDIAHQRELDARRLLNFKEN
jgi:hypothetical protein